MVKINFISGNSNKISEIKSILEDDNKIKIMSQSIDIPEYQEDMIEISLLKAKYAYSIIKEPVFVEDTSLCFNALYGMPGPYIKWFVSGNVNEKLKKLQGLRKMLIGFNDFRAEAVTIISYYDPKIMQDPKAFIGKMSGEIVEPRGPLDFDWDCVFQPVAQCQDTLQTYAEMDNKYKNKISNRYNAVQQFKEFLLKNY